MKLTKYNDTPYFKGMSKSDYFMYQFNQVMTPVLWVLAGINWYGGLEGNFWNSLTSMFCVLVIGYGLIIIPRTYATTLRIAELGGEISTYRELTERL